MPMLAGGSGVAAPCLIMTLTCHMSRSVLITTLTLSVSLYTEFLSRYLSISLSYNPHTVRLISVYHVSDSICLILMLIL